MIKTSYISNQIGVLNETLKQYNDISYLFHFIELNPVYNILDLIQKNSNIIIDDYNLTNPILIEIKDINSNPNILITATENQTLFDLSNNFYGNVSQVLNIILNNSNVDNINQNVVNLQLNMVAPNKK
jgi:hypothetical protein